MSDSGAKTKVLFVCTGNACRSQMAEADVDISAQRSQHVDDFTNMDFDYVITLCGNAEQRCPVFSGGAKHVHRGFDDPVMVLGANDQIMAAFRKARDEIREFVETLPEGLEADV